ncbi:MAG: hypothetical protein MJY97_05730 [Bacteroidales bacterium]|nr:hypothetical protein [Bacteroidales bacterium]
MKKFAVLFAALLQSFLAYSQEAESDNGQFLVIPRVDVNGFYYPSTDGGDENGVDLGDSSFYTLLEGSFGESDFSYSIANHWLSSDPMSLYNNTLRSDDLNWVDWAYVNWAPGAFDFTIGKNMIAIGTFEEDEYDFNSYSPLSSMLWNSLQAYQWGASVGWTSPDEGSYIEANVAASPYGERPFQSGLYAYSARYTGEYGFYKGIWSAHMFDMGGEYQKLFTAGNQFYLSDNWTATLDGYAMLTPATCYDGGAVHVLNWGLVPSIAFDNGGKLSVACKLIMEDKKQSEGLMLFEHPTFEYEDNLALGAVVNWYPLSDSRNLRIHGLAGMSGNDGFFAGIGATYFLNLKPLFRR